MTPEMLRYLALEEEDKKRRWITTEVVNDPSVYYFVIHPSLALECIASLLSLRYSILADINESNTAIKITARNRKKQFVNITRRAKELIAKHTN
ncbi:MAG: hypothetical protein QXM92_02460 [Candidatus Anstonellales archaeon]